MGEVPTGVVTFLFTDVVGSTRLWANHHDAMEADLVRHDGLIRSSIGDRDGYVFSTAGDSFVAAFTRPDDAIGAAVAAQRELVTAEWSLPPPGLDVRMGIHTGAAVERGGDYFGPTLNEGARLMSAAHGGQIVVSLRTRELAPDVDMVSLGAHRLRDLSAPVEVFQVVADGLVDSFPPLRSLGSGLSTLPEHRSSFLGRREEIDRVRRKLADGRLVSLTGVGGVGKTRLAIESAAEEVSEFPGGVFFVDLAAVAESESVVAAVITGIGLTVSDPQLQRAALTDFLHERTALLVIDNCEHLLDPVAELVDDLLRQSSGLRVLATSREALDVEGEAVIRVPSLDTGGAAVRLFVDRAMAVNDQFDPDVGPETIAELCTRLDGIPLAIELAATATLTLSVTELRAGLDDRFSLLRGGRRRGALGRQRTLEATVDWSHDLLDVDEQIAFRRLGIFAGPFIFELMPTVLDVPDAKARALLDQLVAKSLVLPFRIDQERTGFRLLETLRIYASGKLAEAGEHEETSERLADAFLGWIDNCWVAAWRNDWTFWRCFRAQIPDVWRAADDLTAAGRLQDLLVLLGISVFGTGSAAWDEERLRRLEVIERDHMHTLDRASQAEVAGLLALAVMQAGRVAESIERSAAGWAEYASLPVTDTRMLQGSELTIMSLLDPERGIEFADRMMAQLDASELARTWHQYLLFMKGTCVAALGDFARAARIAEQSFVPHDCELRDFALTTSLWFSHLAGTNVDPERLALARSADPQDGYWRQSVCISAAMHLTDDEIIAHELVSIADRGWNGLLFGEEAEYLVAFARLAHQRGDTGRAITLLADTPVRSPWNAYVMAATLRSVENWSPDEWSPHLTDLVLDRTSPDRIDELRAAARARLAEELDQWR